MVVKKKRNKKGQTTKKKITKGTKNKKEINRLKKQLKELTAKFLTQQKKKLSTDKYKILDKKMRGIVDKTNDPSNLKRLLGSFKGDGTGGTSGSGGTMGGGTPSGFSYRPPPKTPPVAPPPED